MDGRTDWEPCPDCEGQGEIDYSEEHERPGTRWRVCWRCLGDKGWPVEPLHDEPVEPAPGARLLAAAKMILEYHDHPERFIFGDDRGHRVGLLRAAIADAERAGGG